MSVHKKRKSVSQMLDASPEAPPLSKKERPWYQEAANQENVGPKDRRKSLIGGFLKKFRSSSNLKDKRAQSSSKLPTVHAVESDVSCASESSQDSFDSLSTGLEKNKELLLFVERADREPSDVISYSNSTIHSDFGSSEFSGFATPSRSDFRRGEGRSSSRSMPGESELVNGLCNSAVRRVSSSVSDSSPQHFMRRKSIRFQNMSGSMADLPEESPSSKFDDSALTPLASTDMPPPSSTKRSGTRRWLSNSKSRVFSSAQRRASICSSKDGSDSLNDSLAGDTTPLRAPLTKSTPSSSSIHKKVSSVIRGFISDKKSSSSNLKISDTPTSTVIRRTKTDTTKEKPAMNNRRHSHLDATVLSAVDVSFTGSILSNTLSNRASKARDERIGRLFTEKVQVSDVPVMENLSSDTSYDAIVVDCLMGEPVSQPAKYLLKDEPDIVADLQLRTRNNPDFQKIFKREGKPALIVVNRMGCSYSEDNGLDRLVRNGIGGALREAFSDKTIHSVLLFPMFCRDESEWNSETNCMDAIFQIIEKALSWNNMTEEFQKAIITGITNDNTTKLTQYFEMYKTDKILPKLNDTLNTSVFSVVSEANV